MPTPLEKLAAIRSGGDGSTTTTPASPREKLAILRGENPPGDSAAAPAHPARESDGGFLDYVVAGLKGLSNVVPAAPIENSLQTLADTASTASDDVTKVITSPDARPISDNSQDGSIRTIIRAVSDQLDGTAGGRIRAARMLSAFVPVIGHPLSRLLGPTQAAAVHRPPTHSENVDAVEGGASLGGMLAASRANRLIERVARVRPPAAEPHPAAPATTPQAQPEAVPDSAPGSVAEATAEPRQPTSEAADRQPVPPSRAEFEATGETLHHGTSRLFDKFEAAKTNAWENGGGHFFTDRPDIAQTFAHEGTKYKEDISEGSILDAHARSASIGDLGDIFPEGEDVTVEGLRKAAKRRIDQGRKVYIVNDAGKLQRITDPAEITERDLDSGLTVRNGDFNPRVITTTVYGKTLDLRNIKTFPPELVEELKTSRNIHDQGIYDKWRDANSNRSITRGRLAPDYVAVAQSPTLKDYAAARGIGKIRVTDAYESGHESVYVPDPRCWLRSRSLHRDSR